MVRDGWASFWGSFFVKDESVDGFSGEEVDDVLFSFVERVYNYFYIC